MVGQLKQKKADKPAKRCDAVPLPIIVESTMTFGYYQESAGNQDTGFVLF